MIKKQFRQRSKNKKTKDKKGISGSHSFFKNFWHITSSAAGIKLDIDAQMRFVALQKYGAIFRTWQGKKSRSISIKANDNKNVAAWGWKNRIGLSLIEGFFFFFFLKKIVYLKKYSETIELRKPNKINTKMTNNWRNNKNGK